MYERTTQSMVIESKAHGQGVRGGLFQPTLWVVHGGAPLEKTATNAALLGGLSVSGRSPVEPPPFDLMRFDLGSGRGHGLPQSPVRKTQRHPRPSRRTGRCRACGWVKNGGKNGPKCLGGTLEADFTTISWPSKSRFIGL